MQKHLLYISISLSILLPFNALSAEWKKLGNIYVHNMVVKLYVDDETVRDDEKNDGYKSLWVKFELPKSLKSNIDKKEYRVRKEKYHYHCDQKLFAVSHLILLDREEVSIYDSGSFDPFSEEYSESWKLITPKSGPDLIYHHLCGKKVKAASTINKPADLSKKGLHPKPIIIDKIEDKNALDIRKIRWAKHEDYERLVIDVYKGNEPVEIPLNYKVTKIEGKNKLKVELIGYTNFSSDFPGLEKSEFIAKIYKEKNQLDQTKNNVNIFIELTKPFKFKFFELENPGRIVIDLTEE